MPKPRNALFILSDQHNAKVLGHAGHATAHTPELDRLAGEGTRFAVCTTANPICTPSRVSFLSGQYAHNHGIYSLCGPRPRLPSILGHARAHGFRTGAIGKIHCPEYWVEDACDVFREVCGGCSVNSNPEYVAHLRKRGLLPAYEASECRQTPYGQQTLDGYVSELPWESTPEGWSVREAIRCMREAQATGQPFLLHVSFPRPHQTYAPIRECWDLFPPERCPLPPNVDYDLAAAGKGPHLIATVHGYRTSTDWIEFEPRTFADARLRKLRGYLGSVAMVDRAVGELTAFLREAGLEGDTAVVYSSDHGDFACEHGAMEKAPGICADAITRIPFIWRVPGVTKAAHVVKEVVESVDMAATLCALLDLPTMPTVEGRNLTAQLRGADGDGDRIGVTEFAWSKSVRWQNWRLVRYPRALFAAEHPRGFGELYDLDSDPWEMRNRWADPSCAAVRADLETRLADWLITTTRPVSSLPIPLADGPLTEERFHRRTALDGKLPTDAIHQYLATGGTRNYL